MATKWAAFALGELREQFPEVRAGVTNCRRIANSSTWSQHAWGNALDLYSVAFGYSTDPRHQRFLDEVAAWVRTYFDELSARTLLWRVRDHFNHIHLDGWPKGYSTPPCAGGTMRMQYNSGQVVRGDPGPANGTPELPDRGLVIVAGSELRRGDEGWAVADLQRDLITLGKDLGSWEPFAPGFPAGADGKYGGATDVAVQDFQTRNDLRVTPDLCDGVTLHFIRERLGYESLGAKHSHPIPPGITGEPS